MILGLFVVALVVGLVLTVLGFVIKAVFWMAIVGIVVIVVSAAGGAIAHARSSSTRR